MFLRLFLDSLTHHAERVDVESGVELVEDCEGRAQHTQLQGLVALFLAAGQVDVEGTFEELGTEPDALGFDPHPLTDFGRVLRGTDRCRQQVAECDTRNLGRVLHGEEQAGLGPLPGRLVEQLDVVDANRAAEHLIARTAGDHVRQGGLARTVRPHDCVHFAGGDLQVDPLQDLGSVDGGPQAFDDQRAHASSSRGARVNTTSPSITATS